MASTPPAPTTPGPATEDEKRFAAAALTGLLANGTLIPLQAGGPMSDVDIFSAIAVAYGRKMAELLR